MRLLRAELARLTLRRLTWVGLAVVVVLLGLLQLQVNTALTPPSAEQAADYRAAYERELKDWEANHVKQREECLSQGGSSAECTPARPTEADLGLGPPPLTEVVPVVTQSVAYLGGLAMFVVAASFIGAEYTSGAIGNWLSFVPQRGRVYAAKLGAVLVATVVGAVGLLVLGVGSTLALAGLHGAPITGLNTIAADAGRALAAVSVFAVIGFVLALLGRHTVAALGAFMAYAVLAFIRGVVLAGVPWTQRLTRWTPEGNLFALVNNGYSYEVALPQQALGGEVEFVTETIQAGAAGIYFAVILVALTVVGALVFRRRDVS